MGPLDDYVSSLGAIGRGSGDVTYDPFATGGPGGDPSYFQDLQSPAELKPAKSGSAKWQAMPWY